MKKLLLFTVWVFTLSILLPAQTLELVKEFPAKFNTQNFSSQPFGFNVLDGKTLFFTKIKNTTNSNERQPIQLWQTDTTEEGTKMIKDLGINQYSYYYSGYSSSSSSSNGLNEILNTGQLVYFIYYTNYSSGSNCSIGYSSSNNQTRSIWRTDGTALGTFPIYTFQKNSSKSCLSTTNHTGESYSFIDTVNQNTVAVTSKGIYKILEDTIQSIDTFLVPSINENINKYRLPNGKLLFSNTNELWVSDGTNEGTISLLDTLFTTITYLDIVNDELIYYWTSNTSKEIWKTDGTNEGTIKLVGLNNISNIQYFTTFNNEDFYIITDDVYGNELWKRDSVGEFSLLKDCFPGIENSNPIIINEKIDSFFYFRALDNNSNYQLFQSDGTSTGTVQVSNFPTSVTSIIIHTKVRNKLFLSIYDPTIGTEPYILTNGNATLLKDINGGTGNSYPGYLTQIDSLFYFASNSDVYGMELWKTDLTPEGTKIVKDIYPGTGNSSPNNLIAYDSLLVFTAMSDTFGFEFYRTNGSSEGTVLIQDLYMGTTGKGSSYPKDIKVINNKIVFTAQSDSFGNEIFVINDLADSILLLKDISPGIASTNFSNFQVFNDKLFFRAGSGYWVSDGTPQNTINLGNYISISFYGVDDNNNIIFKPNNSSEFYALSPENNIGEYDIINLYSVNISGKLWANNLETDKGIELYYGWSLLKDINKSNHSLTDLSAINGKMLIRNASDVVTWVSGGFENNSYEILDRNYTTIPACLDSSLVFGLNKSNGIEMGYFNGQIIDTLRDVRPGDPNARLSGVCSDSSFAVFSLNEIDGLSFWKTDGTKEGTQRIVYAHADSIGYGVYANSFYPTNDTTLLFIDNTSRSIGVFRPGKTAEIVQPLVNFGYRMAQVNKYLWATDQISSGNYTLYYSDGTVGGTGIIIDGQKNIDVSSLGTVGLISAQTDTNYNIYFSEGNSASLKLLYSTKDITERPNISGNIQENNIYFTTIEFSSGSQNLFRYNIPKSQLDTLQKDIPEGTSIKISNILEKDSIIYFIAQNSGNTYGKLYMLDLNSDSLYFETRLNNIQKLIELNNNLYFIGNNAIYGDMLWSYRFNTQPSFGNTTNYISTCNSQSIYSSVIVKDEKINDLDFDVYNKNSEVISAQSVSLSLVDSVLSIEIPLLETGLDTLYIVMYDKYNESDTLKFYIANYPTYETTLPLIESCENESIMIFDNSVNKTGIYYDSLMSVNGCDSVVIQELVVHPVYKTELPTIQICAGDSALIFGNFEKTEGIYYDTLISATFCDSIVYQQLVVTTLSNEIILANNILSAEEQDAAYQWVKCPEDTLKAETNINFTPTESGEYKVIVSKNACSVSSECMEFTKVTNSVNQLSTLEVNVYPNPAKDFVIVSFSEVLNASISIHSVTGAIITNTNIYQSSSLEIPLSGIKAGAYLIEVTTKDKTFMKKLVIQ